MRKKSIHFLRHKPDLAVIALLTLAMIACGIGTRSQEQETANLAETRTSLELTQAALDAQLVTETDTPEPHLTEPLPTPEPSAAQPSPTPESRFTFQGVSFAYDEAMLGGVTGQVVEAQNMGAEMMPEFTYPAHLRFEFAGYPVEPHFYTPTIYVFPVAAYEAISEMAVSTVSNLKSALIEQPLGGLYTSLPSLPLWGAPVTFTTRVQYFDFQNGSGMRYLAMFGQDLFPPDNQRLLYIFQGVTDDGAYYLSAVLPITHPTLPADGFTEIKDWDQFYEDWDAIIAEALSMLEQAPEDSFSPTLNELDALLASFKIEPE